MKKGFTLIELLAVIVILAIIALIATPIVLSIINESKENARLRSAEMYLNAVEQSVSIEKMNNTNFKPNSCEIDKGNLNCEGYDPKIEVKVKGEKPIDGNITFTSGKITQVELKYENGKTIVMNNDGDLEYKKEETIKYTSLGNYQHQLPDGAVEDHEATFDSNGHGMCSKCGETVLAAGLYDENDVMIASWDELVNDYGLDISVDGANGAPKQYQPTCSATNVLSKTELNSGVKLVLSNDVTYVGIGQFNYSSIKEVIMPESVINVGSSAFHNSMDLMSIKLSDNMLHINDGTFNFCDSLKSIDIPDGVTSIGNNAFRSCSGMNSISIPNSVTSIGDNAFYDCGTNSLVNLTGVLSIHYNGTQEQWNGIGFGSNWNERCAKITVHCIDGDITIPAWTDITEG